MIELTPPPKIWKPSRPAIIRAGEEFLTPAAQRGLKYGMFPFPTFVPAAAAPALTTVTFIGGGLSTSNTMASAAYGDLIEEGDLLVWFDTATGNTGSIPTLVVPTGFTSLINDSEDLGAIEARCHAAAKFAEASDVSATFTGMNSVVDCKVLLIFRGNVSFVDAAFFDGATDLQAGNPAGQTINASGGTPPVIALAAYFSQNAVSPQTFSPVEDGSVGPADTLTVKYKIYNAGDTPADISVDMDDEGNRNWLASFYFACT